MEAWITPALANGIGVVGVVFIFGVLIWRGQLIPKTTHNEILHASRDAAMRAEERADRWEAVALNALQATERLIEPVETAAKVLTKIPTPEGIES
jgi:hypothetical protein